MHKLTRNTPVLIFVSFSLLLTLSAPAAVEQPQTPPAQETQEQERTAPALQRLEDRVRIVRDVAYGTEQPERQNLDLYVPKDADKPLPLVVWIHGGAWLAGDKRPTPAIRLLDDGFAVASIHYRFSSTAPFPAQIYDCKAAIRWLRANADNYGIDPNHIGVWGASAGGHLAALLGTTNGSEYLEGSVGNYPDVSSDVQAVVDWFGPSDFFTMPVGKRQFSEGQEPEILLFGGRVSEKRDLAELAGPFHHADESDVPFLIMHGDRDNLVPLAQSQVLHEKLKAAGVDSTLIVMEGKGHGFGRDPEIFEPVEEFFSRTLKVIEEQ